MNDVMVDIETMATGSNSAIVQLGAVLFDRNKPHDLSKAVLFKRNISLQSCIETGLRADGNTVEWWMKKPDSQRVGLYENPTPQHLHEVLLDFTKWLVFIAGGEGYSSVNQLHLWGRSPRFDISILHDAYKKCYLKVPWDFRKEMCVRTIEAIRPDIKKRVDEVNKEKYYTHDTIEDCLHQIAYVSEIWQSIPEFSL